MNISGTLNRYSQPLSSFWEQRNPRERRLLTLAIAAIVLALFYMLLISPALSGREELSKSLPTLRQQVAQMQSLSREAATVSDQDVPAPEPISRASIEAELARRGLKPQNLTVTGEIVNVQFSSIPFAQVLAWLDDLKKASLVIVVESNIVAQDQPDIVNATLTLRQQASE